MERKSFAHHAAVQVSGAQSRVERGPSFLGLLNLISGRKCLHEKQILVLARRQTVWQTDSFTTQNSIILSPHSECHYSYIDEQ
ncbi:hypothetical protein GOODEAATRI_013178 [Goodea atripinnis]|uniref:Uncharacterized protein n=1 Tax=Goodea atripinnis TaxID=208336 RepID=A0ABV0PDQ4_9TELE